MFMQDGAVDVKGCAVLLVDLVDEVRCHVAGQPQLRIAGRGQEVELAALLADQDVAAGEIRAAGQVEADEGDLARAAGDAAAGRTNARKIGEHVGARAAGGQQADHPRHHHRRRAGDQARRQEVAARNRLRVIGMQDGLVQTAALGNLRDVTHGRGPS
jgi:hypothetical protein